MKQLFFLLVVLIAFCKANAQTNSYAPSTTSFWSITGNWSLGHTPVAGEDVIIPATSAVTVDVTSVPTTGSIKSLSVSGSLVYSVTTARTITVTNDVTINPGGSFSSAASGTVLTHKLSLGGNIVNNGILDFSTSGNTAGANITFTGTANQLVSGTGTTTDLVSITLSKTAFDNTFTTNTVELNVSNFSVKGLTTLATGALLTTATGTGTLKFSGINSFDGTLWSAAIYTIPATMGIWINNPNFKVNGQAGNATLSGLLKISNGIYTFGTVVGNTLSCTGATATVIVDGGVLNTTGSPSLVTASCSMTVSAGTANIGTAASTTTLTGAAGTSITINGGTLNTTGGMSITGSLNISAGNVNVGTVANNSVALGAAANIQISGGTIAIAGKFGVAAAANAITYNQTAGTLYTATLGGSNSATLGSFDAGTATTTNFTFTAGKIIVCQGQPSFPGTNLDFRGPATTVPAANLNFAGTGFVQMGTPAIASPVIAATASTTIYRYSQNMPGIVANLGANCVLYNIAAAVINGDVTITASGSGNYTYMGGNLTLKGNSAAFPGNYNSSVNFSTGGAGITLSFTSSFGNQNFTVSNFNLLANMTINNTFASGKVIFAPSVGPLISGTLTLTSGIVKVTNPFYIGYTAPAILTGGSASSYIEGQVIRTFAASRTATGTYNASTLFPVGKNGSYLPIYLDPTTTSGGTVQLRAEAFTTNLGANISVSGTVSQHRWEAFAISGSGNLTNLFMRQSDALIASTNKIIEATSAAGVYQSITPATVFATGLLSAGTFVPAAEFISNGYFCFGDACNPLPTVNGPSNICLGAVSQFYPSAGINVPAAGTWSSSASGIAAVDAAGNVTAAAAGTANIIFTISAADGCNGLQAIKAVAVNNCSITPGGVSNNLISWYKGDAGLTAGAWTDQTGSNNLNASGAPSVTGIVNFNPAATTGGVSDYYSNANASGWTGFSSGSTFYYVATSTAGAGNSQRMVYGRGTVNSATASAHGGRYNTSIFSSGTISSPPYITSPTWVSQLTNLSRSGFNGGNPENYYVNADGGSEVMATPVTPDITGNAPFYIGRAATSGSFWQGNVAEVIAFNGKQTNADYTRVESYLGLKYGISLDQATAQDYTASDGTTKMWNAAAAAGGFNNNIFGIGKDNGSGLDQRIAKSQTGNLLTVSTDIDFTSVNSSHAASLTNNQFLTIADNGGGLAWTTTNAPTGYAILTREWQAQNVNGIGAVNIQFNATSLPVPATGTAYYLLADPSGTGNYTGTSPTAIALTQPDAVNFPKLWVASTSFASGTRFTLATAAAGAPGGIITNLKLWLKAGNILGASNGNPVAGWDNSIQGFTAPVQATVASQPSFADGSNTEAINYNPSVYFNGSSSYLQFSDLAFTSNLYTIFIAAKDEKHTGFGGLIANPLGSGVHAMGVDNNGGISHVNWSVAFINNTAAGICQLDKTSLFDFVFGYASGNTLRYNGLLADTNTNTAGLNILAPASTLGNAVGNIWQGPMSEVLMYNTAALNGQERNQIQSYMALKYGITLNNSAGGTAGDYQLSDGATVWVASNNPIYQRDVIALVRDDLSALQQKQSRTDDDSLRVFAGNLAGSNQANTNTISNNYSSIVIGNDGARLRNDGTGTKPATIIARLARSWKVTNTNFTDNFGIEIKWDSVGPFYIGDLRLLVSDSPDFTNAAVYSSYDVNFYIGSIIVNGINNTIIPANSTKYITIGSVSPFTILGVGLTAFNAAVADNKWVKTEWQTAAEINSDYFTVERSPDGRKWETAGVIAAAGNSSSLKNYSITDQHPYTGVSWYRLKQTATNGQYSYSAERKVTLENINNQSLIVYPNPAKDQVTFKGNAATLKTVRIYNMTGQDVSTMTKTIVTTSNGMVLNISQLTPGIYTIKTTTGTKKMVKQ